MIKAHKIRLNPTPQDENYLRRAAGIARFAWNWTLEEYKRRKAAGEVIDWNEIKKQFRARIDAEFPFVREVTKCAAEEAINDLRRTINTYYKTKKSDPKSKVRFPGKRKRSKGVGGFGLANDKFWVEGHTAYIPKLGSVNMAEELRFSGRVMSGRVKEQAGRWYLIVTVSIEARTTQSIASRSASVGIDFGLSSFATLSDGARIETQDRVRRSERKLRRLQRGLARKQKDSRNRAKWKLRIARTHERIRNQRQDFLHKFTASVGAAFAIICVESLNLKGLQRTRFAKSFQDASIGEAINQLEYKAAERGGIVQKVGRLFASSKLCSECGDKNELLALYDRKWKCSHCGTHHDRDLNAAVNIELEGLRLLAGSGFVGVTTVELAAAASECQFRSKLRAMKQ